MMVIQIHLDQLNFMAVQQEIGHLVPLVYSSMVVNLEKFTSLNITPLKMSLSLLWWMLNCTWMHVFLLFL